jgi:hypothetical protein
LFQVQVKSIVLTVLLALLTGSGALAATSGHLPLVSNEVISEAFGEEAATDDSGSNHGEDVSEVARDKDAIGTKTNPDGKVIENHGQAVQEAAHENRSSEDVSDTAAAVEVPGNGDAPDNSNPGGNGAPGENGNGNSGGNGNGNPGGNGNGNPGGNGDSNSGGNGDSNSGGNGNGHADSDSSGDEDDD